MNDPTHEHSVESLLPYYLNGTLDDAERRLVEQALAEEDGLQAELGFLSALQQRVKSFTPATSGPGELGLKRLQQQIRKRNHVLRSLRGWRVAAIAASVLIVAQAAVMLSMSTPPAYRTAGGATATEPDGATFSVTFTPDATEQEIRAVLGRSDARIIDGPSALGVYQLSLPDGSGPRIDWLRAQAVIESLHAH